MPILDGGTPSGLPEPEGSLNTTQTILLLAGDQLQDITGTKWPPSTLLPYLNLGIKEIVVLKPESYASTSAISLVAGATQTVPATAVQLIDAICNLAVDDTTPAGVITRVEKEKMDLLLPDWMTFPANATVVHVVKDARSPKTFYVFPPQPAATTRKIRALVATLPADLAASDATFPLDDSYMPAAVDYLIYRALAEETTIPNALAKSTMFYQKFLQDLGLKTNVEKQQER
jgi:hypothetical protein